MSINISSCNNFDNVYMRYICEEYLLIMYLDDKNKVGIECQCNERCKIKITEDNHNIFLNIP